MNDSTPKYAHTYTHTHNTGRRDAMAERVSDTLDGER